MTDDILSDYDTCPGCGAALPSGAVFCASCGERLDREKGLTSLLQDEQDISARYRIISLIRRRPSINLYLALNILPSAHGRTVAMRDIDVSSLNEQARLSVIEQAQQEYDLLRRWQPPNIMRAIDLRYAHGHLYTVAGFAPQSPTGKPVATPLVGVPWGDASSDGNRNGTPTRGVATDDGNRNGTPTRGVATEATRKDGDPTGERGEEEARENWPRLTTLQDFLQSGQGLPSEKRALQIMSQLCAAVDRLHSRQIIIGDLNPSTVILNGATVDDQPGLMISWLPPGARAALSPKASTSLLSYFIAPEALQDEGDTRSDIYSLGAFFYLLLTGMPPEESSQRHRYRLRTPHEINPRMSLHISESVMQALAIEPNERFSTIAAFSEALRNPRYRRPASQSETQGELSPEIETVRILPLSYKDLAHWRSGRAKKQAPAPIAVSVIANDVPVTPDSASNGYYATGQIEENPENEPPAESGTWQAPQTPAPQRASKPLDPPAIAPRSWRQRITGMLPAINLRNLVGTRFIASASRLTSTPRATSAPPATPGLKRSPDVNLWIEQIKQAVLGQQQHVIAAAAIIETPLRVLPDQLYTIRMHIMGRNQVESLTRKQQSSGGLSALTHGDIALVEVRSALRESYAYVVQMATVTIPAEGYVAEVSIPMQPLSSTPTGRRDRLHIFFLNEQHRPLYEKPFVLEIFVSHHVKRGSEGHHVLTIPM